MRERRGWGLRRAEDGEESGEVGIAAGGEAADEGRARRHLVVASTTDYGGDGLCLSGLVVWYYSGLVPKEKKRIPLQV